MSILFSAVACDRNVINKYASCDGNFEEILDEVLPKISWRNNKMTYQHGRYLFNYIVEDNCLYFCISDKLCQRSRSFLFLNEIKRKYRINKSDFTNTLAQEMYRYNEDYSKITIRNGELDELNTIGVESSECIIGEKILFVTNDNNLRYTTISYIQKDPERVAITMKRPNICIFIAATCLIAATMFIGSPQSIAIVLTILILYLFFKKYNTQVINNCT